MNHLKRPLSIIQSIDSETNKLRSKLHLLSEPSCSFFENLSNELFYEIFDYLDGCDIYDAFSNLNNRFQNLISCSSIPIKIDLSFKSKPIVEHHCRHLIIPNKHRILSLNLRGEAFSNDFFEHCTIDSSFNRLESIMLSGLTDHKILWILFYLNSLPRLFSLTICMKEEYYYNLGDIYRLIFSLSTLKYNKLLLFDYEEIDIVVPNVINEKFSSITYLAIYHSCTLNELTALLCHTPELCHLICERLVESDENVKKDLRLALSHLTYISIGECQVEFDDFEIFIQEISSPLEVLRISISRNTDYLDANRWERLIKKHIPHLIKFHFNYDHYISNEFSINSDFAFINKFTSSFWFQRKCQPQLKIDGNQMFFSIHPFRKQWFDTYSNRQKTNICSIQLTIEGRSTTTEKTRSFINKVNSSCVTVQFNHLNLNCYDMSIGMLIEIIRLLPNLYSLKISSLPNIELTSLSIEDVRKHLSVSNKNKITKVKLEKMTENKQIQFLINLCPRMQYLEIDCMSNTNPEILMKSILINQMTYIPNLCSVCLNISNANETMIRNLAMIIDLETLVNNYTIQRMGDKIFLHWTY